MALNTKIQWCTATWNPWRGCHKVSDGCKFCYCFRLMNQWGNDPNVVVRAADKTFRLPYTWKKPERIFMSMTDPFVEEADPWRDDFWKVVNDCTWHTFLILTKRMDRANKCLPLDWEYGENYPNVQLGVSVENNDQAKIRLPQLDNVDAAKKFVSFEPLLEYIEFGNLISCYDWAIIGGESGSLNPTAKYRARPCELTWIDNLIDYHKNSDIPIFMKQMGSYLKNQMGLKDRFGGDPEEWPEQYRIREIA